MPTHLPSHFLVPKRPPGSYCCSYLTPRVSAHPRNPLPCTHPLFHIHASIHSYTAVPTQSRHLSTPPKRSQLACPCSSGTPGTPPAHSRPPAPTVTVTTPPRQAAGLLARAAATRPPCRAHRLHHRRHHRYRPPCRPRARTAGLCRGRATTNGAASGAGAGGGSGVGLPVARWWPRRVTRASPSPGGGRTA